MIDGLLIHKWDDPQSPAPLNRVVVPVSLRELILRAAHGSAHLRRDKMAAVLQRRYMWPGYMSDIGKWVKACGHCQETSMASSSAQKITTTSATTPLRFGEVVSADLLQLPETPRHNKYLLLLIDHFSRFVFPVPLKDKRAITVARTIRQHWFDADFLGPPENLLTDRGGEFRGETERLCKSRGVKQLFTLPGNPRGNSITERANRTALGLLRGAAKAGNEWDKRMADLKILFNATPHSSGGAAPIELITLRPAPIPNLSPAWLNHLASATSVKGEVVHHSQPSRLLSGSPNTLQIKLDEAEKDLLERARYAHNLAHESFEKQRDARRHYTTGRDPTLAFRIGDRVLLRVPRRQGKVSSKLSPFFRRGFVVRGFTDPNWSSS